MVPKVPRGASHVFLPIEARRLDVEQDAGLRDHTNG
jgi:hypothetical protein